MNEIKRLQQLAGILTEIKVNNPNHNFKLTPAGKKVYTDLSLLYDLIKEYGNDNVLDTLHESDKYQSCLLLSIFIDEALISLNDINTIDLLLVLN